MSDEPALLAAIQSHPDEDTPRLVYADWLDENSRPDRAEFIRLQCVPDADETQLMREAELEERNRGRWLVDLGVPQFAGVNWSFRRGFPELLAVTGQLFLERYEAFVRVPWVRALRLYELHDRTTKELANRPWNPNWVELEFQNSENAMVSRLLTIIAIARCSQAQQLRTLRLAHFDLPIAAIQALIDSPHLQQLQQLVVDRSYGPGRLGPLQKRFGDRLVTE